MATDGLIPSTVLIKDTSVTVTWNESASRFEVDDPSGTGTFKLTDVDGRLSVLASVLPAFQSLVSTTGAGVASVTMVDGLGVAFATLSFDPTGPEFKLANGPTEFVLIPGTKLSLVPAAIALIEADDDF